MDSNYITNALNSHVLKNPSKQALKDFIMILLDHIGPVYFDFFKNDFYSVIYFSVKKIYKETFHKSFK